MADLVTRLKLDDKNFNDNIKKSKAQLDQFKAVGSNVTKMIGQFAVAIGVATTAQEAFERVIRGSQATSDEYDRIMRSCTTSVDAFFTSISTGDFSAFDKGLEGIILKARAAQSAIDQLGNTTMSYNYFTTKYSAEIEDALLKARDESLSKADRDAALKTAEILLGKQDEITNALRYRTTDALKKVVAEKNQLNTEDFSMLNVEDVFLIDAKVNSDEIKAELTQQYEDYKRIKDEIQKKYETKTVQDVDRSGNIVLNKVVGDVAAYNNEIRNLNAQYKEAILYDTLLNKYKDKELQDVMNMASAANNADRMLASMQKRVQRVSNTEIKKQKTTTNDKVNPLDLVAFNAEGWVNEEIKGLHNPIRKAIESGEKIPIKNLPIEIEDEAFEELELPKLDNSMQDFGLTLADSMNLAGQAMYGLGSAFQAFSDNAAVGKASLILGAIGQLVMGYATATAQAAKLGPWAWIGFAATGLGVLATTISQIKGFADGGIVDSPYTTGDRNLIKVNGGEMILTKGQQANLFSMLQHGTASNGGGQVTFKIQGKELVGVLNNYNNKVSKVL